MFCSRDGATLIAPASGTGDLVGHVFGGKYRIVKRLGGGGMGDVYLAEHVRLKKPTAVKVIRPALTANADAVARFNREAQNASMINHPNVASVYDFGETDDGMVFLAMEFVEGQPLSALVDAGPIAPARAANIVRQVCDALTAAHRMGIVHRDLKPENIMLCRNVDGTDMVKLVDFGIAKIATGAGEDQKITATGSIIGTPAYLSPEQVRSGNFDARSDIYSLAIVVFQMLTGQLPFEGDTPQAQMVSRLVVPPQTLQKVRPDVSWSGAIESVIAKGLALEPEDRYQTALEFSGAFMDASRVAAAAAAAPTALLNTEEARNVQLRDQRTVTAPTPAPAPPGAAPARSRLPLALAAAVVLVAAGGGAAFLASQGDKSAASTTAPADSQRVAAPVVTDTQATLAGTSRPAESVASKTAEPPAAPRTSAPDRTAGGTRAGEPGAALQEKQAAPRPAAADPVAPPVTPPATTPATTVANLDEDIRALAARLRQDDIADAELRGIVDQANRLVPRARSATDSIRILYTQAQALALMGNRDGACQVLGRIKPMATQPPYAAAVTGTSERLGCS